ncbi:hypothetical protein [Novosphingobium sp. PC22D]|uniref:hypothetical protein n=1 Tax=Novosphingobium sp. PC22D TaxID=1962403 RepID=UPI0014394E6C|nr:hypothetical protein [Novosphingobium sp. PC22D]
MIDMFALVLTHGLMLIAIWRLLSREDLDREGAAASDKRRARAAMKPLARQGAPDD